MAHVMVATNLWDQPEATALGEILKDEDAWRFVVRLWGWGIDSGCETGRFKVSPHRLAAICGFRGPGLRLLDAMLKTGWLRTCDGDQLEIRGWDINQRFFREKQRLRAVAEGRRLAREEAKAARVQHDNGTRATRVEHADSTQGPLCTPSRSPSPSLKEDRDRGVAPDEQLVAQRLEQLGFQKYGSIGSSGPEIRSLLPITGQEFLDAFGTRGTSWAYFAKVVRTSRERAAASPASSGPPQRDGRVGHHPGSRPEEFVDGEVNLKDV